MDYVPASDEEDISFPAPVAAPKSNPLEDPYSFEALVGMYNIFYYVYLDCLLSFNFLQLSHHVETHVRRRSPHTIRQEQRDFHLEVIRPALTSNPSLSLPRSNLRPIKPPYLLPPLPNSQPRHQRNLRPRHANRIHLNPISHRWAPRPVSDTSRPWMSSSLLRSQSLISVMTPSMVCTTLCF